jgi:copper(I)-binding protein
MPLGKLQEDLHLGESLPLMAAKLRLITTLTAAAVVLTAAGAFAQTFKAGSIEIESPWARATPKGATIGAGYMKITNTGTSSDRLISGSSDVAPKFEVHEMKMDDDVMKMRPVQGGLEIKPGETLELKPGLFHVMFVGLKEPLKAGNHIEATLVFDKAGAVNLEYDVLAMGAEPNHDMPGMKMPGH